MFNKETEYALRSLVYIQHQNDRNIRPGIEEIAKEIEAPHAFTAKILQRLVRLGFVQSAKGRGGGFFFDPNKPVVTLHDLIQSTEGTRTYEGCGFGLKTCDDAHPCPLHFQYAPIRAALQKLVREESIQSLARNPHSHFKAAAEK
ncbi:MAG: Rrf2 family transcriptional regulator [Bacteroidales bacterium]|jgi:Rrf2 family protein|nr:Rrf2 family transcriptional regulator [Bacteroidales bacterium]HKL91849.1 Rrf2 family transcriptional regulator [Bacteroidales bacterium]